MALRVYCKVVAVMDSRREGQGLVEYGLVLAIIALVAMAALKSVGQGLMAALTAIANDLATR